MLVRERWSQMMVRNLEDYPVTVDEIIACLGTLADDLSAQAIAGDLRPYLLQQAQSMLRKTKSYLRLLDGTKSEKMQRVVFGVFDAKFHASDAPDILGLSIAMLALTAAVGHNDKDVVDRVLGHVAEAYERLRPEVLERLIGGASGLLEALHNGKKFVVAGEFEPPGKPLSD